MTACSANCAWCGRCEAEPRRYLEVPCDTCGRIVAIRSADENLPTVLCERCQLGDGDDGAGECLPATAQSRAAGTRIVAVPPSQIAQNDAIVTRYVAGWFRKTDPVETR